MSQVRVRLAAQTGFRRREAAVIEGTRSINKLSELNEFNNVTKAIHLQ